MVREQGEFLGSPAVTRQQLALLFTAYILHVRSLSTGPII